MNFQVETIFFIIENPELFCSVAVCPQSFLCISGCTVQDGGVLDNFSLFANVCQFAAKSNLALNFANTAVTQCANGVEEKI